MPDDCYMNSTEQLWMLFKGGDVKAFESIMKTFYRPLFNYGTRFCKNEEIIKDSIQELFLGLWKNRNTIKETLSVKNYLLKSLRNKLYRETNKVKHTTYFDEVQFDAGFNMVLPVENNLILQEKLT